MDEHRKLTKQEKKELRKQEKALERDEYRKSKLKKRLILWGSVLLGLAAVVFVIAKLATAPATPTENKYQGLTPVEKIDWSKDNASASATLIEYGDFQCPACKYYETFLSKLHTDMGDKVHFIFRHFPLRGIHPNAQMAAQAAEAAGKQNKFWEMHDMLYDKQEDWSKSQIANETFTGYASELGLNIEQFKKDYDSQEVKDRIQRDVDSGNTAGVDATPTFFLNGTKIDNPQSYDAFKDLIEKATQP